MNRILSKLNIKILNLIIIGVGINVGSSAMDQNELNGFDNYDYFNELCGDLDLCGDFDDESFDFQMSWYQQPEAALTMSDRENSEERVESSFLLNPQIEGQNRQINLAFSMPQMPVIAKMDNISATSLTPQASADERLIRLRIKADQIQQKINDYRGLLDHYGLRLVEGKSLVNVVKVSKVRKYGRQKSLLSNKDRQNLTRVGFGVLSFLNETDELDSSTQYLIECGVFSYQSFLNGKYKLAKDDIIKFLNFFGYKTSREEKRSGDLLCLHLLQALGMHR